MNFIWAVVIVVFVLAAVLANAAKRKNSATDKYSLRCSLLSPAEIAFDNVLRRAVPELKICPKVRVADVVAAKKRYSGDFLRISQKHFDWVLCEPTSFAPLVAIELDDSSHSRNARTRKSDATKNSTAACAGLKILRIKWAANYDENNLREQIAALING